jgi:ferric-dicitrate binding protein FerR (iron transport regulator)
MELPSTTPRRFDRRTEIDMNTIDTNTGSSFRRRLAAIAIVGALALSFAAAFGALKADDATGDGMFAWLSDYITAVGEALGR